MENNEHDRQIDNRTRGMRRQRPQATEEEIAKRKDILKEKVQERKQEMDSDRNEWNVRFKHFKDASIVIGDELKNFLINFDLDKLDVDDENKKLIQKSLLSIIESESLKQWISTQLVRSLGRSTNRPNLTPKHDGNDISNNQMRNTRLEARENLGTKEGRRPRINPQTREQMGDRLKNQQRMSSNRNGLPPRKPNRPDMKKPDSLKGRPNYKRPVNKGQGGVRKKPDTKKRYDVQGNPIDNQW